MINLCVSRVPLPQYIKDQRGEAGRPQGVRQESPPPSGSRIPPPPILVGIGFAEGGKEREGPAPSPCPIRTKGGEGRAAHLGLLLLFSTKAHLGPYSSRGVPVTSRYSGKIPISPGTLPMSKYRLPIYQSLCLDHFETPHHVRDHIRDPEQPLVHQNTKTLITIVNEL